MSYQIYITEALVCGTYDRNTSDRSVALFTREAGMLYATVKSAREERSKHRYALQDFSVARVSLVRGKTGWRVTGAEPVTNLYWNTSTREGRAVVRNVVRLLRRFVNGEEPMPDVYDDLMSALSTTTLLTDRLELLLTLRTLSALGYIDPEGQNRALIEADDALSVLSQVTASHEEEGKRAIARAFETSHL